MTPWTWVALGAALMLAPLGDPVFERLRSLGAGGRLAPPRSPADRVRLARLRPGAVSAPAVGAVALLVVTVRAGPVLGMAAGMAAATGTHLLAGVVHRRAAERSASRLLAAVRIVVAEVQAGSAPEDALAAAGEVDPSRASTFSAAAAAVRSGSEIGTTLSSDPQLRRFAHAWTIAAATGAPVAAVLERVAADLAAQRENAVAVSAALAGPRSSAAVLAALPLVGILLGVAMDADPFGFLLGTPGGQYVCLAGVALDVAGLLWTRGLAASAQR